MDGWAFQQWLHQIRRFYMVVLSFSLLFGIISLTHYSTHAALPYIIGNDDNDNYCCCCAVLLVSSIVCFYCFGMYNSQGIAVHLCVWVFW